MKKSKSFAEENDKPVHIIDKLDKCLKRFSGFGFVDPDYLVTLYPFKGISKNSQTLANTVKRTDFCT
jgi:hypothetical protein